jgi:hypothetical protein
VEFYTLRKGCQRHARLIFQGFCASVHVAERAAQLDFLKAALKSESSCGFDKGASATVLRFLQAPAVTDLARQSLTSVQPLESRADCALAMRDLQAGGPAATLSQ